MNTHALLSFFIFVRSTMKPIKGELHMSNNYREFNVKLWEKMAEPWDKRRDWQEKSVRPVTDAMLLQL